MDDDFPLDSDHGPYELNQFPTGLGLFILGMIVGVLLTYFLRNPRVEQPCTLDSKKSYVISCKDAVAGTDEGCVSIGTYQPTE